MTQSPSSSPSSRAGSSGPAAARIIVAASLTLLTAVVVGAHFAQLTAGEGSTVVSTLMAAVVALITCVVIPMLLDRWVTRAYRKVNPAARSLRPQTVMAWNAVVLLVAIFALPQTTRNALEARGDWFVAGDGHSSVGRGVSWMAQHIPRSAPPDPTASPTASQSAPDGPASAPPPLSSAAPRASSDVEEPSAISAGASLDDRDHSPQELFAARADSVVVIRTRTPLGDGHPQAAAFRQIGIKTMDGSGSGFVVSPDGLIATNFHVAGDAAAVMVRLHDGREFSKVVRVATLEKHDLTLLSIPAKSLSVAPLSESDEIPIGAGAIAIGSPLGLEYSVTDGIVSAVRDMQGTKFLQMQTTIAPGSSGGPLFNQRGRVIGVNTGTKSAGINLAVHVQYVRELMKQKRKPQKLDAYRVGVELTSVEFEGADVGPVDRLNYEQALRTLGAGLDGCIKKTPKKARLDVTFESSEGRLTGPKVDSNLGDRAERCLDQNLQLVSGLVGQLLTQHCADEIRQGKPVSLKVHFGGLPKKKSDAKRKQKLAVQYWIRPEAGGDDDADADDDDDGDATAPVEVAP